MSLRLGYITSAPHKVVFADCSLSRRHQPLLKDVLRKSPEHFVIVLCTGQVYRCPLSRQAAASLPATMQKLYSHLRVSAALRLGPGFYSPPGLCNYVSVGVFLSTVRRMLMVRAVTPHYPTDGTPEAPPFWVLLASPPFLPLPLILLQFSCVRTVFCSAPHCKIQSTAPALQKTF